MPVPQQSEAECWFLFLWSICAHLLVLPMEKAFASLWAPNSSETDRPLGRVPPRGHGNREGMLDFLPQVSCTPGPLSDFHKVLPTRPQFPQLFDETLAGMGPSSLSGSDSSWVSCSSVPSTGRAGTVARKGWGSSPITPKAGSGSGQAEGDQARALERGGRRSPRAGAGPTSQPCRGTRKEGLGSLGIQSQM